MSKLEKIKEYFIKNNITMIGAGHSTDKNGKKSFGLTFYTNISDFNSFIKLKRLKNE
jgi:hypothetical protein